MLPVIENLLILQDRDRKIMRVEAELANLAPERAALEQRAQRAQAQTDAGKLKAKQLESDRKKLELDVEAKKGLIEKYSLQQFQTKKNEEYRALAHAGRLSLYISSRYSRNGAPISWCFRPIATIAFR